MTDERYQKIMADLGMPHSRSLLQALQQVANEVAQEVRTAERERWKAMMQRAIATCFDERARREVMSDPQHFAAEALRA